MDSTVRAGIWAILVAVVSGEGRVDGRSGRLRALRPSVDVVVGRQPIFDRSLEVFGYELLFRQVNLDGEVSSTSFSPEVEGPLMTPEVLFNSVSIGIDRLVSDKRVFLNADRALITGSVPLLLPPERVVVEVLETVLPEPEVIAGCRRLVARRFTLALDDFVWFAGAERLLELASIVKIDVLALDPEEVRSTIGRCREFDVRLVAEKVETPAQLERCVALGFDYFQGYLLARPDVVAGRPLDADAFSRLQLVARLLDEECEVEEIEAVIQREPLLSQQLLELAGLGAARGLRREIRTIREAIVLLGAHRLRSWAGLMLMIPRGDARREDVSTALVRARMCELLAEPLGQRVAQWAFTAGMVSAFDLLLGMEIRRVLDTLPLAADLRSAVLRDHSPVGHIVADVCRFQLGQLGSANRSGLSTLAITRAWTGALEWATDVSRIAA